MCDATKSKLHSVCSFDNEFKTEEISNASCSCNGKECSAVNGISKSVLPGSINSDVVCSDTNNAIPKYSENYGTFPEDKTRTEHKPYAIRYLMLLLFSLCSMMNGFQYIQYSSITSIITCYYEVSVTAVNWTAVLFMVMYIPFYFPVIHFMNNKGLRYTLILGAAGNCLSSCIQCLSLAPDRFYVVIISQLVASISQCCTLSVPPLIAALWFGSEEISLACSIGVFANQLGNGLGFLIPSVLVNNDCNNKMGIKVGLMYLAFGITAMNTLLFLSTVLVFKDKPKQPPSLAEARKHEHVVTNRAIFKMMKSSQFLLMFCSYGLILSVYFAILAILNQLVVRHFPGREADAGRMGLISIFTGMAGSVVCGYILDKTHQYRFTWVSLFPPYFFPPLLPVNSVILEKTRLTSIMINILSTICMVAYTVLMQFQLHIWMQYVMIAILGFVVTGYIPVGFEIGAEMTYPEPEGTSASWLNLSVQAFGIVITMFGSWLLQTYGDLVSNLFFCLCMLVGCILTNHYLLMPAL